MKINSIITKRIQFAVKTINFYLLLKMHYLSRVCKKLYAVLAINPLFKVVLQIKEFQYLHMKSRLVENILSPIWRKGHIHQAQGCLEHEPCLWCGHDHVLFLLLPPKEKFGLNMFSNIRINKNYIYYLTFMVSNLCDCKRIMRNF